MRLINTTCGFFWLESNSLDLFGKKFGWEQICYLYKLFLVLQRWICNGFILFTRHLKKDAWTYPKDSIYHFNISRKVLFAGWQQHWFGGHSLYCTCSKDRLRPLGRVLLCLFRGRYISFSLVTKVENNHLWQIFELQQKYKSCKRALLKWKYLFTFVWSSKWSLALKNAFDSFLPVLVSHIKSM